MDHRTFITPEPAGAPPPDEFTSSLATAAASFAEVYKRLTDVLGYHEGTIKIEHRLTPIGVAMAGANEFDPYKD